jgi:hypothetical protein
MNMDELLEFIGGIPDKIQIEPIYAENVEIGADRGYTYTIFNEKIDGDKLKMKVKHANTSGLRHDDEKETKIRKDAEDRGYKVIEFLITDV